MNIERTDKFLILTPDEGKALTNGDVVAEYQVYLPLDADTTVWYEIDKPSPEDLEDATIEDYEQSLNKLGI